MSFNMHVDRTITVTVGGRHYPVSVAGEGMPVVVIGTGTLVQRTLSENFKNSFTVYASDLYWYEEHDLPVGQILTMERAVDDIYELLQALKLPRCLLVGHSAFGMMALEFEKKYPGLVDGVVMIGTSLNETEEAIAERDAFFYRNADEERKKIDAERKAAPLPAGLSDGEEVAEWCTRRHAARYWHNPLTDSSELWQGLVPSRTLCAFFGEVFSQYDVREGLEKIQEPVFLAAGLSDYDCLPAVFWPAVKDKLPQLEIAEFKESGHYPCWEKADLFDQRFLGLFTQLSDTRR